MSCRVVCPGILLALAVGCDAGSGPAPAPDAGIDADVDPDVDSGSDAGTDAALPAACGVDCCGSVPSWVADATWPYPMDTAVVDLAIGSRGEVVAAAVSSYEISSVSYVELFSPGLRDRTEVRVGTRFVDAPTGVARGPDGSVYVVGREDGEVRGSGSHGGRTSVPDVSRQVDQAGEQLALHPRNFGN